LAIGTTGQVLTVSGGVPTWATSTVAFDSALNQRVTGQYTLNTVSDSISSGTRVLNTVYYSPIFLKAGTYDRILLGTGSGHTNTTVVRMGLYNASTTTGLPTTVAFDAGTVSCTAATTNYTITISQTIATGWYYLAMVAQTVGGVAQFLAATTPPAGVNASKSSLAGATNQNYYFTETGISGAFATAGTLSNAQSATAMGLRNA
jgi:hypothetical protein